MTDQELPGVFLKIPPRVGSGGGRAERRAQPKTQAVVGKLGDGRNLSPRVRFVAERGSASYGTAYNKLDWEVIDKDRSAGNQCVCRTTQSDARLIVYALNNALPAHQ